MGDDEIVAQTLGNRRAFVACDGETSKSVARSSAIPTLFIDPGG